jgi:hypothetical protein
VEDHHVDRPEVEAEQSAQPTGTNRSNPPDPNAVSGARPNTAGKPPACSGKRPSRDAPAAARQTLLRHLHKSRPGQSQKGRKSPKSPDRAQQIRGPPRGLGPGSSPGLHSAKTACCARGALWRFGQPGGHSEGPNTRSHPELGRENPQRRWYCVLRRGRAGRRQARQTPRHPAVNPPPTHPQHATAAGWSSPVARQAHNRDETRRAPRRWTNHAPVPGSSPGMIRGPNTPLPRGGAAR